MMLRSLAPLALWILTVAAGPGLAQIATIGPDARGIPTIAPLIDRVDDAVVSISVVTEQAMPLTPRFRDPFFQPFLPLPEHLPQQREISAGSGVIVDARNGHILTNNHVVEAAESIRVQLQDKRSFKAELVGSDPATDIAVLKIDAANLTDIETGDSEALLVGDFVVAIGNPFGLGQTVTSGIVSALGRSGINPQGYEDFIQTDASINPGNSGGALITLDGKLVGINTAIISPNGGGNVGVGFAVPINMAIAVMDQILRFGEVQRGQLGVIIEDLTPDLATALGLEGQRGAVVASVGPGTPAEEAGLQAGDVIVSVDGIAVETASDLRQAIGLRRADKPVTLGFLRNGERNEVDVRLSSIEATGSQVQGAGDLLSGVGLAPLGRDHPAFGLVEGVVVVELLPGSLADQAGLEPGDVITAINRRPVTSAEDIRAVLADNPRALALSIWRDGRLLFLVVES
jgi:serine protease DegQ